MIYNKYSLLEDDNEIDSEITADNNANTTDSSASQQSELNINSLTKLIDSTAAKLKQDIAKLMSRQTTLQAYSAFLDAKEKIDTRIKKADTTYNLEELKLAASDFLEKVLKSFLEKNNELVSDTALISARKDLETALATANSTVLLATSSSNLDKIVSLQKAYKKLSGAIESAITKKFKNVEDINSMVREVEAALASYTSLSNILVELESSLAKYGIRGGQTVKQALSELVIKFNKLISQQDLPVDLNTDFLQTIINDIKNILNWLGASYAKTLNRQAIKDWGEQLKKATSTAESNRIWADYYKADWGANADLIAGLGETFKMEAINLGFSDQLNPFIAFLRWATGTKTLKHSTTVTSDSQLTKFKNLPALSRLSYGLIHNAYVRGLITDSDLRGAGKFAKNNLIFCKSLYEQPAPDLVDYLTYQYELSRSVSKLAAKIKDMPTEVQSRFMLGDTINLPAIQKMLFFANGSLEDGIEPGVTGNAAKLAPLARISAAYKSFFDEQQTNVKRDINDTTIKAISDNIKNISVADAKDLLIWLIITYMPNQSVRPTLMKYRLNATIADITSILKYIELIKQFDITYDNIEKIITLVGGKLATI